MFNNAPQLIDIHDNNRGGLQLPKRRRRLPVWLIVTLVVIVLLACVGIWYNHSLTPKSSDSQPINITVASGATAADVAGELQKQQVIRSALAMRIYMITSKQTAVQAGVYQFSPSQKPADIAKILTSGSVSSMTVTILPGKSLIDLKNYFKTLGFSEDEIDAAFAEKYDHPLFKHGKYKDLEGYIYPETFFVDRNEDLKNILIRSFDEFEADIKANNIVARLKQKKLTLNQGIILASIIEQEVPSKKDRRQVAQVFLDRLKIDMPLGSDVTFRYAAQLLGQEPTIDIDSPYNTRKHAGFPPGAVGTFSLDSLLAVLDPAPGDYLYFVSGDDGTNHFSRTKEEHERKTRLYCTDLCFPG